MLVVEGMHLVVAAEVYPMAEVVLEAAGVQVQVLVLVLVLVGV
jgi:hypothetical protein